MSGIYDSLPIPSMLHGIMNMMERGGVDTVGMRNFWMPNYYASMGQNPSPGSGGGTTPPPSSGGGSSPTYQWKFPQYSQTWAFTPPAPTAFQRPPAFDPKSSTGYATAPKPSTTKPSTPKPTNGRGEPRPKGGGPSSPFSLNDLWGKYR